MKTSFSTSNSPNKAVIAIHGWTGDVTSMDPVTKSLKLPDTLWIIPQAPFKSEKKGFTWFQGNDKIAWEVEKSLVLIQSIIQDLTHQGFKLNEIFLLGFSQGACLSMEFMIRQDYSLGGIIPIAGFIKNKNNFVQDATNNSKKTKILLIHGNKDEIILPDESQKSFKIFQNLGYKVNLKILSARHKVPLKARDLIHNFIFKY